MSSTPLGMEIQFIGARLIGQSAQTAVGTKIGMASASQAAIHIAPKPGAFLSRMELV